MTDDRILGGLRSAVGRVEDAVGGLTGDMRTQVRGKLDQAAGSVQDAVGQARGKAHDLYDDVENYAREQPLTALAIALGVGAVLGLILLGGRSRD